MATATTEKPTAKKVSLEDVALALEDKELPAAELLKTVGERALTVAWTGGYVEFGHRNYTVTGNPDNPKTRDASELHIENGVSWSGPKKATHCSLRELLARGVELPHCGTYKFNKAAESGYQPVPDVSPLVRMERGEAEKLVYLAVRLTDKGHQLLLAE